MNLLLVIMEAKRELQFANENIQMLLGSTSKKLLKCLLRIAFFGRGLNTSFRLLFSREIGLILHSSLCSLHADFSTKSFLSHISSVGSSSVLIIHNDKYQQLQSQPQCLRVKD
jgi:hypothetical protein